MTRRLAVGVSFASALALGGCGSAAVRTSPHAAAGPPRQSLRSCVDRWNQGNMVDWRSLSARVAVRGLSARERGSLSYPDPGRRRCIVSLAPRPGVQTWICILGSTGAYDCPLVTSDGMPPLRHANGRTDGRGILELRMSLAGTRPAPPLAWQRFPHVDGYIVDPWTHGSKLRPGLRLEQLASARRSRGNCLLEYEYVMPKGALRCVSDVQWAPCFPPRPHWNRLGTVLACGSPGSTTFARFVITRR